MKNGLYINGGLTDTLPASLAEAAYSPGELVSS